jgi:hypothetical protein
VVEKKSKTPKGGNKINETFSDPNFGKDTASKKKQKPKRGDDDQD